MLVREYTRLRPPDRAAIEVKRKALLGLVESTVADGKAAGVFHAADPKETARAIITLATTLALPFPDMGRDLGEVIELYQGFAVTLATATPPPRRRSG